MFNVLPPQHFFCSSQEFFALREPGKICEVMMVDQKLMLASSLPRKQPANLERELPLKGKINMYDGYLHSASIARGSYLCAFGRLSITNIPQAYVSRLSNEDVLSRAGQNRSAKHFLHDR